MNKKPVVLVVMDGVGETPETLGNMVMSATTPTLDELKAKLKESLQAYSDERGEMDLQDRLLWRSLVKNHLHR